MPFLKEIRESTFACMCVQKMNSLLALILVFLEYAFTNDCLKYLTAISGQMHSFVAAASAAGLCVSSTAFSMSPCFCFKHLERYRAFVESFVLAGS